MENNRRIVREGWEDRKVNWREQWNRERDLKRQDGKDLRKDLRGSNVGVKGI